MGKMFVVGMPFISCYHLIVKHMCTCCGNSKAASTVIDHTEKNKSNGSKLMPETCLKECVLTDKLPPIFLLSILYLRRPRNARIRLNTAFF